jgi:hypothetical protein
MRSTISQALSAFPFWLVCCGLLLLAGCGKSGPAIGKLVPVRGKVMVAGKLLAEGYVSYYPINAEENPALPEGKIQPDGSYTLTTAGKPGAPAGKYRATIDPGGDKELNARLDRKYLSPKNSPLEITVEDRPDQVHDLEVPGQQ